MPNMWCYVRNLDIRSIYHYETFTGGEEMRHIGLERLVVCQMVNDIQRYSQVGGEELCVVGEAITVIQVKALRWVVDEPAHARLHGRPRHIKPNVAGVICERELIAVAAAELDYRLDAMPADEIVKECGLALGEVSVRTHTARAAVGVSPLPVRRGAAKQDPVPEHQDVTQSRQRTDQILESHSATTPAANLRSQTTSKVARVTYVWRAGSCSRTFLGVQPAAPRHAGAGKTPTPGPGWIQLDLL
jgi:hypothetical protein